MKKKNLFNYCFIFVFTTGLILHLKNQNNESRFEGLQMKVKSFRELHHLVLIIHFFLSCAIIKINEEKSIFFFMATNERVMKGEDIIFVVFLFDACPTNPSADGQLQVQFFHFNYESVVYVICLFLT